LYHQRKETTIIKEIKVKEIMSIKQRAARSTPLQYQSQHPRFQQGQLVRALRRSLLGRVKSRVFLENCTHKVCGVEKTLLINKTQNLYSGVSQA
jgi:hypothetical protein